MKLSMISSALAMFWASAALAAEVPAHTVPKNAEEWLARMTNFTQNASAYRDPRLFMPWFNAMTEPDMMVSGMKGAMSPGGWLNMANSAANPDAVRNWLWVMDPATYMKWMQAGMDPNFYTAMLTTISDPGKMMRWAMTPMDPKLWNVMLSTLNPNTYVNWGMAGMDPRTWNLMGNMANPALYTGMMGAVVGPNTLGTAMNPWLSWRPSTPVGASNPWVGDQGANFNLLDPALIANFANYLTTLVPSLPGVANTQTQAPSAAAAVNTQAEKDDAAKSSMPTPEQVPSAPTPLVQASDANLHAGPASPSAPSVASSQQMANTVDSAPVPVVTKSELPPAAPVIVPSPSVAAQVTPAPVSAEVPKQSKVILSGDTLFNLGKTGIKDLSKEGRNRLDELVRQIAGLGEVEKIDVVGHADATGNSKSNMALSEARARSVKAYLVAKGIKSSLISVRGAGDMQPVVQCDKKLVSSQLSECLAPNRRVEVTIIAKKK